MPPSVRVAFDGRADAALAAGTPRHAGISGKKKGPETIRALVSGGGWLTMCRPASRAYEHWRGLLRADDYRWPAYLTDATAWVACFTTSTIFSPPSGADSFSK